MCNHQGAAGVDDEDEAGLTPLHTAAELGSVSQAELLLERGASINHAGAAEGCRGCVLKGGCEKL